jgi:rhodanese-related sulfurtransferase
MPLSLSPSDLAARLREGPPVFLLDVRQPAEHALAALTPSQLIPLQELPHRWHEIHHEPGVDLVCYCHHGVRSWHAAAFLEQHGLGTVYSLTGGIDAWSCQIDSSVPRYT